MSISLKQLKYFIRVAEAGSFTAASEEILISQPAIGKQIKLLEQTLGVALLMRHSRGTRLTSAGRKVHEHAKAIVKRFDEMESELRLMRQSGTHVVELGVTPMTGRLLANRIVERALAAHHDLRINIQQGYSDDLMRKLAKGEIDLTFSPERGDEASMVSLPLFDESFYLVGPSDMMGEDNSPIHFSDAVSYPLNLERSHHRFHRFLKGLALNSNVALNVALETDDENLRLQMMRDLRHCTISPLGLCSTELGAGEFHARLIVNPTIQRTLFIVARRTDEASIDQRTIVQAAAELSFEYASEGRFGWRLPAPMTLAGASPAAD